MYVAHCHRLAPCSLRNMRLSPRDKNASSTFVLPSFIAHTTLVGFSRFHSADSQPICVPGAAAVVPSLLPYFCCTTISKRMNSSLVFVQSRLFDQRSHALRQYLTSHLTLHHRHRCATSGGITVVRLSGACFILDETCRTGLTPQRSLVQSDSKNGL